ncbi:class I SAM-dependent methyltransferase [Candidatus Gottesmanbacteria bacterium]|nr:class I SAM-dependent methyltransferase [Candidatus Gottesmanbacteria bacterium]
MSNKYPYTNFNNDPYHTHQKLLEKVRHGSKVLEIGCATGYFTSELLRKGCIVTPVEINKDYARIAQEQTGIKVISADVLKIDKYINVRNKYDYILLADVLEHTSDPFLALTKLANYLGKQGKFIISIPNIANFSIRLMLLFGHFDYQDWGIMDRTHKYFFTHASAKKLFDMAQLSVSDFDVVSGFETSKLYKKTIGPIIFRINILRNLEYLIAKSFPNLYALEFIYELSKK